MRRVLAIPTEEHEPSRTLLASGTIALICASTLFLATACYSLARGENASIVLWACLVGLGVAAGLGAAKAASAARQLSAIDCVIHKMGLDGRNADRSETLSTAIEDVRRRISYVEAERDGLKAILAAMEEGVLVVDSRKCILVANAAARKMMRIAALDPIGSPLVTMTSQPDLLANIELSIVAAQTCSFEFQLPIPGESTRCCILAHCAPFHDETRELSGAVVVLHDISEIRRLERMRTEFVANVSHELRTPLTSLLGYLETLEHSGWDDADQANRFLSVSRRQGENLSRIVEDLLRLSKLENPQQDIATTEIDLVEVAGAAVEQCQPLALQRRVTLTSDFPDSPMKLFGDRGLLVQAISNLIENAVNYNRETGRVTVRLARLQRADSSDAPLQWEVAVSDTGIGIPQGALKHVFERFYRVDKARSRDRGGTGLGLAIVKHIALAHGASVHVESDVGKGSTFYLRFKASVSRPHNALAV
jgi:two-component system phosphate regulon sensor histidine kinase PhoR